MFDLESYLNWVRKNPDDAGAEARAMTAEIDDLRLAVGALRKALAMDIVSKTEESGSGAEMVKELLARMQAFRAEMNEFGVDVRVK